MSSCSSRVLSDRPANCSLAQGLHCRLLGPSSQERCQLRLERLQQLGLLECDRIPTFDEVTQQVAKFLQVPVCVVTVADHATEYVKAAYGLSHLGWGSGLARLRHIPLEEGLGTYVLDSEQILFIADTGENPVIATSQLAYTYGVGAYGAVPLITSLGECIGTLAVMDPQPRAFTPQEQGYMAMAVRWGMSEYERCHCSAGARVEAELPLASAPEGSGVNPRLSLINAVRLHLIGKLTQDLHSPLTAVLGMTRLLGQEIYGPLTQKQREYIEIVHDSSKALMEQVQDIVELGAFEPEHQALEPTPVDMEMLGQQVVNTLGQIAAQRSQVLSVSIEPGERVWHLDKSIVKQILYHVVFSVMQMAGENGTIRIHASRKGQGLQLAVWLSNPWLGDGLPQSVVRFCHAMTLRHTAAGGARVASRVEAQPGLANEVDTVGPALKPEHISRELLGLLLSQELAEFHGGYVTLQGSLDAGYRFVVVLPTAQVPLDLASRAVFTQA